MCEPFRDNVILGDEDDSCALSEEYFLVEQHLEETSLQESSGDDVVVRVAHSPKFIEFILDKAFDLDPFPCPLHRTPSSLRTFHESLGDIRWHQCSLDPYYAYLEDVLRNIMWNTFFDYAFDFSMAFDKFKKTITMFATSLLVFSYSHHFEMHVMT